VRCSIAGFLELNDVLPSAFRDSCDAARVTELDVTNWRGLTFCHVCTEEVGTRSWVSQSDSVHLLSQLSLQRRTE